MRLDDLAIDRILGATPCLCGTVNGWHGACYAGKSQEQIDEAYKAVYRKFRRIIREKKRTEAADELRRTIDRMTKQPRGQ